MAGESTRSTNPAIREVARGLVAARDVQILQVVAMVDAMPARGPADQLIAPLRSRLARLRPPRPLRFARLLFLPLDPLIVPAPRWRPEQPTIPRTAIPVLAAMVETALGGVGQTVAAMIEGRTTQDHDVVDEAGRLLWNPAAGLLMKAGRPADWDTTGLVAHAYTPLARRIGALLFQAERLRLMMADAAQGLVPPALSAVRTMLADAIGHEAEAQPMAIALLLARIPESAAVLSQVATSLGQRGGASMRQAGEQAADLLLDQLSSPGGAEGQLGGQDLAEAGASVHRLTLLLGALDGETLSPGQKGRLNDVRQRVRAECESLFTERLGSDLMEPLRVACEASEPGAPVWALEAVARGLRVLETEARRAGGENIYDTLLGQSADMVREMIEERGLDRVGGLRLMEIVAGPEVALALLGEEV
jgi:hypothetical protein